MESFRQAAGAVARLAVVLLLATLATPEAVAAAERFGAVVIDAGHGGDDEGARGPGGALEKDVVLRVARGLASALGESGLQVVMTRSSDTFVALEQRTSIANDAGGDLFVSIHANAADSPQIRGSETFFLSLDASDDTARLLAERENRAFGAGVRLPSPADDPLSAIFGDMIHKDTLRESQAFAAMAQRRLAHFDPEVSRGVKQAPFVVLSGVRMPAALVEIGFITNAREERELGSSPGRRRIVGALAQAILEFAARHDAVRGLAPAPASGSR